MFHKTLVPGSGLGRVVTLAKCIWETLLNTFTGWRFTVRWHIKNLKIPATWKFDELFLM